METIGIIATLLLLVKIGLHIYLLSQVEEDFRLLDYLSRYNPKVAFVMLLPSMDNIRGQFRVLKTIINILYTISFVGFIIFLVWHNAFRKET